MRGNEMRGLSHAPFRIDRVLDQHRRHEDDNNRHEKRRKGNGRAGTFRCIRVLVQKAQEITNGWIPGYGIANGFRVRFDNGRLRGGRRRRLSDGDDGQRRRRRLPLRGGRNGSGEVSRRKVLVNCTRKSVHQPGWRVDPGERVSAGFPEQCVEHFSFTSRRRVLLYASHNARELNFRRFVNSVHLDFAFATPADDPDWRGVGCNRQASAAAIAAVVD